MDAVTERERFRVWSIDAESVGVGPSARVLVGCADHERDVGAFRDGEAAGLDWSGRGPHTDLRGWVVAEELLDRVVDELWFPSTRQPQ